MKNELENYLLDKLIPTTFPTIKIVETIKSLWDLAYQNFDFNVGTDEFQHTFPEFNLQIQIYSRDAEGCYYKTSHYDLKIVKLEYHATHYFTLHIGDSKENFKSAKLKISLTDMSIQAFANVYDQNDRIFNQYKKYNNILMFGENFMKDFGESIFKVNHEDYFMIIPDYELANLFMKLKKTIENGRRTF